MTLPVAPALLAISWVHRTKRDRKARQKLIDDLVAKLPKDK